MQPRWRRIASAIVEVVVGLPPIMYSHNPVMHHQSLDLLQLFWMQESKRDFPNGLSRGEIGWFDLPFLERASEARRMATPTNSALPHTINENASALRF